MTERLALRITNALSAIPPATEQATAWLEDRGAPASAVFLVELIVEELVSNCVKFAYADGDTHVIDLEVILSDAILTVMVVDDGLPFDPLAAPQPDTSLNLEERSIGGLGLHLLRMLSDEITYERQGDKNCLVVTKRF